MPRTSTAASNAMPHFGRSRDAAAWTGRVERRDPATVRGQSVHETWRCPNPACGHWTMNGAYLTGRCNFCFTARPRACSAPARPLPF